MIEDFLGRNNNVDAIILIIIGIIIPSLSKATIYIVKKTYQLLKGNIKVLLKFLHRRTTGNYNLNELELILNKPESKRSKKEKLAVIKYQEVQIEIRSKLRNVNDSMAAVNKQIYTIKNINNRT